MTTDDVTSGNVTSGNRINSSSPVKNSYRARTLAFAIALLMCQPTFASDGDVNKPGAGAMAVDMVVARPILLGVTIISTAIWIVALPFSALGGNVKDSAQAMVVDPARATFVRCLGCTSSDYPTGSSSSSYMR
jgi:hypothetical protein